MNNEFKTGLIGFWLAILSIFVGTQANESLGIAMAIIGIGLISTGFLVYVYHHPEWVN